MRRSPVRIDFAPRRLRPDALVIVLMSIILAVVAGGLSLGRDAQRRVSELEATVDAAHKAQARAAARAELAKKAAPSPEHARAVNSVIRRLNLPWDAIFESLNTADSPAVALLALEPDANNGVLKLSGEAGSIAALLQYEEQLENQPALASAVLTKHDVRHGQPGKPVRFSIEARWRQVR